METVLSVMDEKMRARFSFVIPTRQEAEYIGRSLRHLVDSRTAQQLDFEIIIVDGKSTDATVQEATGLADKIITDDPLACASIAHARNIGAAAASGEFLFHTDADVIAPDLPGLLSRAAREFGDPRVVAVTAPVMPYPWDSTWLDRLIHRIANAHFRASFRYGAFFARGECQIVRRAPFDEVDGYRGDLISGEDCDLFRRLGRKGKIIYIPDMCVYHSLRRFRKLGYLRVLGVYVREWMWMSVFRRSFTREWTVVR
jgi:glycosyltransferase involved in cell wall biosynthesis